MIFVLTTGQCGSRVLTDAIAALGHPHDSRSANLDSQFFAHLQPYGLDLERPIQAHDREEVREFLADKDGYVFKALATIRFANLAERKFGIYRHPALWKQACERKGKRRTFEWWARFHERMLEQWRMEPFPLFDFGFNFENSLRLWFGDTHGYDPTRVTELQATVEAPREALDVYAELTLARCRMEDAAYDVVETRSA